MATEKRLIDANVLIEKFRAHRDFFISAWNGALLMSPKDKARVDELGMCIAVTLNAPTVDAVEVVRCKDCRYRHTKASCQGRSLEWYCPNGERM